MFLVESMHPFVQLLEVESSLSDLPLMPPQGVCSLPLQQVCLQNCVNIAHANGHVESRCRFRVEEIRMLLDKLQLPNHWQVERPNEGGRFCEFNSEELLLFF